jgi:ribosomal protein S21
MSKRKSLVTIVVKKGDINKALKMFKKKTFDSGHLLELRDRQTYTKPKTVRRKQKLDAIRRQDLETLKEKMESGDTSIKLQSKKSKKKNNT